MKKYINLAEEMALAAPILLYRFCAYKSTEDYNLGNHYFIKDFDDFDEMKGFSAKHSEKEKTAHPGYCSTYWKVNAKII